MNIVELVEGIKSGAVKLTTNGHNWGRFGASTSISVIDHLEDKITFWQEQLEESQPGEYPDMYSFYLRRLTGEIRVGSPVWDAFEGSCFSCSTKLHLSLVSETEAQLITLIHFGLKEGYKIDDSLCLFSNGEPPITTELSINSDLYFVNHFGEFPETPDDTEWSEGYSLNYHIGRLNISKYLAFKNIGYGQVGNTSIEIYLRKDRKAIWITEYASDFIEDDAELAEKLREYTYMGSISLGVWRWMCADADTIRRFDLWLNNKHSIEEAVKARDVVKCPALPGKWKVTHYDNTDKHKFDGVTVATMELQEDKS